MVTENSGRSRDVHDVPEYQMFPRGMWHMLAAVILMVPSLGLVLIFVSYLLSSWTNTEDLQFVELGLMVVLVFTLSTPTFLVSRGRAHWHRFLLRLNLVVLFLLGSGVLVTLTRGDYGMSLSSSIGFLLALAACFFYRSSPYQDGVEHYRKIWTYYRQK